MREPVSLDQVIDFTPMNFAAVDEFCDGIGAIKYITR